MTSVADHLIATLAASGVERVFGLPGDSLNCFTDAVRRSDLDWVHVRHEEAAAFAAAGEAGLTGELAVCAGSCGPGNLHLINGLFDAQRSGVPVLAIAAHIPRLEIGSGYFQETHPQELFRECSVYCELVSTPEMLPRILELAMRAAVEERGVAVIVVPGEIFLSALETADAAGMNRWAGGTRAITASRSVVRPTDDGIAAAAELLNTGEKVTILGGIGTADAREQVLELAGLLNAPIVHSIRAKEILEHDNPFDVGMTGLLGFASGYKAMKEAEVLLMLGTDFPYPQFFPTGATVIQVDLRGRNLGRRTPVELGLVGSVRDTLDALLPLVEQKKKRRHLDGALKHYRRSRASLDALAVDDHERTPIRPEYVAELVSQHAASDAVFTVDVGSPVVWAARYLKLGGGRRLIGSFNHGSMAGALPHAVGAASVDPARQVIALAGDGGLAMSFGELLTLMQNGLPVKIVVFDNSSLNFVELEMKAAGIVNFGTELQNPDFADVASAIGLFARRVERPSELGPALDAAFAHDGPALIDVVTARQELAIPPAISAEQAKGFTLYGIRTILSGRGEELLDLVTTNVARRLLK